MKAFTLFGFLQCCIHLAGGFLTSCPANAAMALDDVQRREYLQKNVTADLQYIWDDSEVSLDLQHRLGQHYKNLRVFVALAESSTELREALKTDYQLDAAQGAGQRAEVARIISAWTAGRQLYEKENELQAESKVMGLPRSPST